MSKRPSVFAAMVDGRCIVRSRRPFFDAARALIREGNPTTAMLEARHAGSVIVAMRSELGEAAKWTVAEADRRGLRRLRWCSHPKARNGTAEPLETDRPLLARVA